jgi:hypothetical protein
MCFHTCGRCERLLLRRKFTPSRVSGQHPGICCEQNRLRKRKEIPVKDEKDTCSRRSLLTGSALLLTGGIAGRISNAVAAPAPPAATASPLPWKWTKLDPLEAGRRAYRGYLTGGG